MPRKIRKQVYLEPRQDDLLKSLSKQSGLSEAEMIRQVIDRQLGYFAPTQPDLSAWEAERAFIEEIKQRSPLAGDPHWTRNELHER